MSERALSQVIVALDLPGIDEALRVVEAIGDRVSWYKVGYEAFYGYGARLIPELRSRGKNVFLDLKLHDIPTSVAGGIRSLADLGASLLSVHAGGGREMLLAAAQARDALSARNVRLLAVTLLTSMGPRSLREVGVADSPHEIVSIRAALAAECGIDGVVCAVDEVAIVRARVPGDFLIVCPGIRALGAAAADQQRIATPTDAMLAGASAIVVGRPITQAADPAAATQAILDEIEAALPIKPPIGSPGLR